MAILGNGAIIYITMKDKPINMSQELCWYSFIVYIMFCMNSVFHLLLICLDRFFGILFPFIYKSKSKAYITILIVWITALCGICLVTFKWSNPSEPGLVLVDKDDKSVCLNNDIFFFTVYIVVFFIPFVIMIICYSLILSVIYKRSNLIQKTKRSHNSERRATISIAIVFLSFLVCWAPNIYVSISGMVNRNFWKTMYMNSYVEFLTPNNNKHFTHLKCLHKPYYLCNFLSSIQESPAKTNGKEENKNDRIESSNENFHISV